MGLLLLVQLMVSAIDGTLTAKGLPGFPLMELETLISSGAIFAYGLRKAKAPFSEVFPLARVPRSLYFPIALCFVGMGAIAFNISRAIYTIDPPPAIIRHLWSELINARGGYWNAFFEAVLIGPLTEEFLFRGLILRGFLKRYGTVTGVVASAVLFGAAHGNVWQAWYAVVGGLFLGWLAVETHSLAPCLFGHALWNAVGLAIFLVGDRWPGTRLARMLQTVHYVPAWFVLAGACAFGAGMVILTRHFQARPSAAASGLATSAASGC